MQNHEGQARLQQIAQKAMIERDLCPDFSPAALAELAAIDGPAREPQAQVRDLRGLVWASIDNDDSRDLDQLTVARGTEVILVAIADVDALVKKGSALDRHAQHNTTSVYTGAAIFPMLPEKLSTDLTSLGEDQDRLAVVVEMAVDRQGVVGPSQIYRALVRNHAKLAYNSVAAWLDGGPMPPRMAAAGPGGPGTSGVDEQIRTQDQAAQRLRRTRHHHGALELLTLQPRPIFADGAIVDLSEDPANRAKALIEDFMIAANGVTARFLSARQQPSLRRVVRTPRRWPRIVAVAAEYGEKLPDAPDALALQAFLERRRQADPLRFPDLSLIIVKLMGNGEYVVERPGEAPIGHFGLAVRDYTHSTAPNRRYSDLITQRLLKAALSGQPPPYDEAELSALATRCTQKEDDANKVERRVRKSASALLLGPRIGEHFDAVVTGAADKGTWVRLLRPPIEGKLVHGFQGVDVGDKVRVKLVHVDVERGFIDFVRS